MFTLVSKNLFRKQNVFVNVAYEQGNTCIIIKALQGDKN